MNKRFLILLLLIGILFILILVTLKLRTNDLTENENTNTSNNELATQILDLTSQNVKDIVKKFHFGTSTKASIYKTGNFEIATIPNELILRMAWNQLDVENETEIVISENQSTQTATETAMQKSVENLFGNQVDFYHQTFENIDSPTFEEYNLNRGTIRYKEGQYTANYCEGGGGSMPYIYETAEKVLQHNNKIEIYVKTAFIDTSYDEEIEDFKNFLYSDFDFETETFVNPVITVNESDLYEDSDNSQIQLISNSVIETIKEKLNTYVYTFEKENSTNDYKLVGFHQA